VKSQIGHTKCTAGIAGLIKVSLSLHNRVLPATLNLEHPNPGCDASSPFSLNTAPRPWPGSKRKAGVSAFGFGGTNFHAVVEEYEAGGTGHGYDVWPSELFLLRGRDTEAALGRVSVLSHLLERDENWRLRDLARSTSAGSEPVRIAVVANDLDDLRAKLGKAAALQADPTGVFIGKDALGPDAKVAFLYPGQGSQSAGMLRDLFIAFPDLQRYLELDESIAKLMVPPSAWDDATREAQRAAITDTRAAQPALGIGAMAVTDLLRRLGLSPDMVAGHSYGELAALSAAGAIDPTALVSLSAQRAACILDAAAAVGDSGAMAAVAAAPEQIQPHITGIEGVVIANLNGGEQTVISGATSGVAAAVDRLREAGLTARPLDVACAFHSPIVASAAETFLGALKHAEVRAPSLPVFSNTGGERFAEKPEAIR
jgi:acyl transferase domain-containing protein